MIGWFVLGRLGNETLSLAAKCVMHTKKDYDFSRKEKQAQAFSYLRRSYVFCYWEVL
jgi:hypothetical protein